MTAAPLPRPAPRAAGRGALVRGRSLLVLVAILGVAGLAWAGTTRTVDAQTTEAEWAFVPLGLFGDERVRLSLRLQMDEAAAGDAAGVALRYHDGSDLPPAEDADILLYAAGIVSPDDGRAAHLIIERPCRAWAAEGLAPAAEVLGAELARVWARYQVQFPPCGVTDDPTLADILVFAAGSPPAEVDLAGYEPLGSFLSAAPVSSTPGGTPVDPAPAQGGSLGGEETDDTLALIAGLLVATAVLAGARVLTGTGPGAGGTDTGRARAR